MRITPTTLPAFMLVTLAALSARQGVADEPSDQAGKTDRAAMRARMLKRINTNRDGKLSKEELAKARSDFARRQGGSAKLEHHRLEVVTFPEKVQNADANMNDQALLYHPIKQPEGKIPLIVLLHGAGGTKMQDISAFKGKRDVGTQRLQLLHVDGLLNGIF